MKIGKYFRKYRIDKGYSQECVAEFLGVSQKTFSNMENDKSNLDFDTIKKLIVYYKIDISSLALSKFVSDGKFIEQNFETHDQISGNTINNIPEKLNTKIEEHIEELKARTRELENLLAK